MSGMRPHDTPLRLSGPTASLDDPVVDRRPLLAVLDDVARGRDVELDVDDTLIDREIEVPLGDQGEVLGVPEKTDDGEVALEEHREVVEPVPAIDAGDILGRGPGSVSLGQRQQCGRVDRALEVHMELGLGKRPHVVGRKRAAHRVTLRSAGGGRRRELCSSDARAGAGEASRRRVGRRTG